MHSLGFEVEWYLSADFFFLGWIVDFIPFMNQYTKTLQKIPYTRDLEASLCLSLGMVTNLSLNYSDNSFLSYKFLICLGLKNSQIPLGPNTVQVTLEN